MEKAGQSFGGSMVKQVLTAGVRGWTIGGEAWGLILGIWLMPMSNIGSAQQIIIARVRRWADEADHRFTDEQLRELASSFLFQLLSNTRQSDIKEGATTRLRGGAVSRAGPAAGTELMLSADLEARVPS
jgi:hypothetical protein